MREIVKMCRAISFVNLFCSFTVKKLNFRDIIKTYFNVCIYNYQDFC